MLNLIVNDKYMKKKVLVFSFLFFLTSCTEIDSDNNSFLSNLEPNKALAEVNDISQISV